MINYLEYLQGGNVVTFKDGRQGGFHLPNDMLLLNNIRQKINEWKQKFNEYKRLQEIIPENDKNNSSVSHDDAINAVRLRLSGNAYNGIRINTVRPDLMSSSRI